MLPFASTNASWSTTSGSSLLFAHFLIGRKSEGGDGVREGHCGKRLESHHREIVNTRNLFIIRHFSAKQGEFHRAILTWGSLCRIVDCLTHRFIYLIY